VKGKRFDINVYNAYYSAMNSREIIKRLKSEGWELVHVRGSHHKFCHPQKKGAVTVPHPKKDFPAGTLKNIFKQAGWEWR